MSEYTAFCCDKFFQENRLTKDHTDCLKKAIASVVDPWSGNEIKDYQAVWLGVVLQAVTDLSSRRSRERLAGFLFLQGEVGEIDVACARAGLDPDFVKRKVNQRINLPHAWRLPHVNRPKRKATTRKVLNHA